MDLKFLKNDKLLAETRVLVRSERECTLAILKHLNEIERRRLYAERGYSSLFEYVVVELKYSEAAAQRRISSMRLLKELPELSDKMLESKLNLSTLAKAYSFFRFERPATKDEKRLILKQLEGKSGLEVQRELLAMSSKPEKLMPPKIKPLRRNLNELTLVVDDEFLRRVQKLKECIAHVKPQADLKEVLDYALSETLKRKSMPLTKTNPDSAPKNRAAAEPYSAAPTPEASVFQDEKLSRKADLREKTLSRYIPPNIRREVWARDRGLCTYVDPTTGRACKSAYALEIDHIQPFSKGGTHELENLRLRCRAHNQLAAIHEFGIEKMKSFFKQSA